MNLKTLYPVDAQAFSFQLSKADSVTTFQKHKDQTDTASNYWNKVYDQYNTYIDTLAFQSSTQAYLKFLNSPKVQANSIGRWLVSTWGGSSTEPIGQTDSLPGITIETFASRVTSSASSPAKKDRILVIYGATHLYFLKGLIEASPELLLEEVLKYLN